MIIIFIASIYFFDLFSSRDWFELRDENIITISFHIRMDKKKWRTHSYRS